MLLDKIKIKKILIISLSNIGDVILTFPVIDVLRAELPQTEMTILVGPKGEEFFKNNSHITEVIPYNKRQSVGKMIAMVQEFRRKKFDLVVDLRNTAIPFFTGAKYHTPFRFSKNPNQHKKEQHLNRLRTILNSSNLQPRRMCVEISNEDKNYVNQLLKVGNVTSDFVVIAPGAANHNKRWPYDRMAQLADYVIEKYQKPIVFVGDQEDQRITILIARNMKNEVLDLSGKLNLNQLAYVIQQSIFFIGNDSAPMHLASYMEKPVLAFFGPSDPKFYGPWSQPSKYLQNKTDCKACLDPTIANHDCIRAVTVDEAIQSFQLRNNIVIFK